MTSVGFILENGFSSDTVRSRTTNWIFHVRRPSTRRTLNFPVPFSGSAAFIAAHRFHPGSSIMGGKFSALSTGWGIARRPTPCLQASSRFGYNVINYPPRPGTALTCICTQGTI